MLRAASMWPHNDTVICPEWFGAKGDDSTDDTVALQAAITAAQAGKATLQLRRTTYKTTAALTISGSGTAIRGVVTGTGGSVIKIYSTTLNALQISDSVGDFNLADFTLDRVGIATADAGLYIGNGSFGHLARLEARNHYDGFALGATANATATNCKARLNYRHGFRLFNSASSANFRPQQWEINNCNAVLNDGWGFYFQAAAANTTLGTWDHPNTYANTLGGICVVGQSGCAVSDLVLRSVIASTNGGDGIRIDPYGGSNNRISGAFCELSGDEATGRGQATAASHLGKGIYVSGNSTQNGSLILTDINTFYNSEEGFAHDVPHEVVSISNFVSLSNARQLAMASKFGLSLEFPPGTYYRPKTAEN